MDQEALAMVRRAQPFPPPPEQEARARIDFAVPIRWQFLATSAELTKLLRNDRSLELNSQRIERKQLGKALARATSNRTRRVCLFAATELPRKQIAQVTRLLQSAGFPNIVLLGLDPPR